MVETDNIFENIVSVRGSGDDVGGGARGLAAATQGIAMQRARSGQVKKWHEKITLNNHAGPLRKPGDGRAVNGFILPSAAPAVRDRSPDDAKPARGNIRGGRHLLSILTGA